MFSSPKGALVWFVFIVSIIAGLLLSAFIVRAADCPPNARSCKVITLTPEEEQILLQPNGILAMADWANRFQLSELTRYFRDKIAQAPAGNVQAAPVPGGSAPSNPDK